MLPKALKMATSDPGSDQAKLSAVSRSLTALEFLIGLLRSGADLDRIVDGYLETRRLLAGTFRRLAQSTVPSVKPALEMTREHIQEVLRAKYSAAVPASLLVVRDYSETHLLLLGYLFQRVGGHVSAARLRILTGEQVHTERRVRELRDLGYQIRAERAAGEQQYILVTDQPNLEYAALAQLRLNVKDSRTLGAAQKKDLLTMLEDSPGKVE